MRKYRTLAMVFHTTSLRLILDVMQLTTVNTSRTIAFTSKSVSTQTALSSLGLSSIRVTSITDHNQITSPVARIDGSGSSSHPPSTSLLQATRETEIRQVQSQDYGRLFCRSSGLAAIDEDCTHLATRRRDLRDLSSG